MKKLAILSAITLSGLVYNTANAQIGLHVGLRLGPVHVGYTSAPVVVEQAPVYEQAAPVYQEQVPVYDNPNDYYYLPDVDAYYDVNDQCYFYNNGYDWVSAPYLPGVYRDFDWRRARHYEIRASRPYMHAAVYRERFNGRAFAEWNHRNFDNGFKGGDRFDDHFRPENSRGNVQRFENDRLDHFNDQRFDNRDHGFGQQRDGQMNGRQYDNRNRGFGQPMQPQQNQQYDNRRQGNGQPMQPQQNQQYDNRRQGNGQSMQPEQNQGNRGQQFDSRGQERGGQPANNNNGGQRPATGGNEHFAQNAQRGGFNRNERF